MMKEDDLVKEKAKVVNGPVNLGGAIGRVVKFPDGTGRVETWGATGWEAGGADLTAILRAIPASANTLKRHGVPEEDWPPDMLEDWRRKQRSKGK